MAYRGDYSDPAGDFGPIATNPDPRPDTGLRYDFLRNANGVNVYQGSDGQLYTDDAGGMNGFKPYTAPVPTTGGSGGGGVAAAGGQAATPSPYQLNVGGPNGAPSYVPQTPVFQAPQYVKPPAFSYGDFVAPTGADVLNDPGYQFRRDQGQQQLMNNKAASGVLNTGGTIKDFLNYNQNFASQEYGNVYDRAANTYGTNRGNAFQNYQTNYGTQYTDPYKFNYQAALDEFAPQMEGYKTQAQAGQHESDQNMYYGWQRYLEDFDQKFKIAGA